MAYKFNPFTGKLDYYTTDENTGHWSFVEDGYNLHLYFYGQIVHTWTITPPSSLGSPIGLLLSLTHAS